MAQIASAISVVVVVAAHVIGAGLALGDDRSHRVFQLLGHGGFAQVIEHHLGRQDHGDGVDLVHPHVLRSRTVAGLENGHLVADVAAAGKAEAAHQLCAQIADDVPEHVAEATSTP